MSVAYSTFANNGYKVEPIKEVKGKTANRSNRTAPRSQTISVTTAVTTGRCLAGSPLGDRRKARWGYQTFGKTGTTNDWTDAWLQGIPLVVSHVGNDDHTPSAARRPAQWQRYLYGRNLSPLP